MPSRRWSFVKKTCHSGQENGVFWEEGNDEQRDVINTKLRTIENYFYLFIFCLFCLSAWQWDLIPEPGIELVPSAVEAWSDHHWTTKEVPKTILIHNITETGVQIGDFQTEVFISIMINRDLNSSGSPMNCAYFIGYRDWMELSDN